MGEMGGGQKDSSAARETKRQKARTMREERVGNLGLEEKNQREENQA